MQIRCDFRDGEAECLLHPSFVARRIKGDLLWFVNMRAFDSDWNETMCRIRLKTMCGEWRPRHVLDFTRPYASAHYCGPIVWSSFCCEVGFCPVFCSVMGYNNLYKSQWLSWSTTVWAWHWWKAWFSRGLVSRKLRESLKVSGLYVWQCCFVVKGISLRFSFGEEGQIKRKESFDSDLQTVCKTRTGEDILYIYIYKKKLDLCEFLPCLPCLKGFILISKRKWEK